MNREKAGSSQSSYLEPIRAQEMARWLVFSPPLLKQSEILSNRLKGWWDKGHECLGTWEGLPRQRRLGRIAEDLLARYISSCEELELVHRGLAIRESGRTLGEIDFIVQTPSGLEHWELAIKFYLLDLTSREFIGPNGKDRLHLKVEKMLNHQLPLGRHPRVTELCDLQGKEPLTSHSLVKGRLFYPRSDESGRSDFDHQIFPQKDDGIWVCESKLTELEKEWSREGKKFSTIGREAWLSRDLNVDHLSNQDREPLVPNKAYQGILHSQDQGSEEKRLFIVPTGWPNLQALG